MKKIFSNNRLIIVAFFTVFSATSSSAAWDKGGTDSLSVELKYIGDIKNQPLFQLNFFSKPEENEFIITIRDWYGNSLFTELIKGEVFSKKFLFNMEEMDDEAMRVEIFERKSNKTAVFEVNRNVKYHDAMQVSTVQ